MLAQVWDASDFADRKIDGLFDGLAFWNRFSRMLRLAVVASFLRAKLRKLGVWPYV